MFCEAQPFELTPKKSGPSCSWSAVNYLTNYCSNKMASATPPSRNIQLLQIMEGSSDGELLEFNV